MVTDPQESADRCDRFEASRECTHVTVGAVATTIEGAAVDKVASRKERLRALIDTQYEFVWRSLRRCGVAASDAEDWTQEVFVTASRRLDDIETGRERGFLYRTAMHYAAHAHRTRERRREVPYESRLQPAGHRTPEDELNEARALQLFYLVLERLSLELRSVFVLYELEQFTTSEIAETLQLPLGTVASRLRRARKAFLDHVQDVTAVGRGTGEEG